MPAKANKVKVPVMPYYGDEEMTLDFPAAWDVHLCQMKGWNAPRLTTTQMRKAFANPIGTKTIREMAKGKKEVVILFDDLSRGTPADFIVPFVLEELKAGGIKDDNIRFIAAFGAHGAMNNLELAKKLGPDILRRYLVYQHNPYENCVPLGQTSWGTPVAVNAEYMACDLRIGIGAIVPHPFGFGGGSKIILPGVVSMDTIDANHTRLGLCDKVCICNLAGNILKADIDEAAKMARLDVKVDAILNIRRQVTGLFVGDFIGEYKAGVKVAREHYATEMVTDCNIVVANCYQKANEITLAPFIASPLLTKKGGDMVLMSVYPAGQILHYFGRSFGKKFGGRGWNVPGPEGRHAGLPENAKKLTVFMPYPDKAGVDWLAPYELVNFASSWNEVITDLKKRYGSKAKVAVIPDATVQYFPDACALQGDY